MGLHVLPHLLYRALKYGPLGCIGYLRGPLLGALSKGPKKTPEE